jgi:excisionase family DNA binding protein
MSEALDRLLTAEEAARFLGLKTATIRRLTYTRELPVIRPTGERANIDLSVSESHKIEIQFAAEERSMTVSADLLHLHEREMKRLK